jgi:hypothetical protein
MGKILVFKKNEKKYLMKKKKNYLNIFFKKIDF